jgi:hypothetical protein
LFIVYKFNNRDVIKKAPGNIYKVVAASSEETIVLNSFNKTVEKLAVSCIDLANNESGLYEVGK